MNRETSFEERLRKNWTPRRPSARVGRRLFEEPDESASREGGPAWRWLAPATGVALVAFFTLGMFRQEPPVGTSGSAGLVAGMAGSNLAGVGSLVRASQTRHNNFAAQRFDWTSSAALPSSSLSSTRLETNNLRP
jgi:hypothetical protein